MGRQVENGKSFEYACLLAIYQSLVDNQSIVVEETPAFVTARKYFDEQPPAEQHSNSLAAVAAARVLLRLEPQLTTPQKNGPLYLSIQEDKKGIAGDVRDVLCIRRQNEWEIGLSCKHNHVAVKHSRLSRTIDFGQSWFGKKCTQSYFDKITPIFNELSALRKQGALWNQLEKKAARFYMPVLKAFVAELNTLNTIYPQEIPPALIRYLLGRNDFYKVILKHNSTTEIQPFNLGGTLNRAAGTVRPETRISPIQLPTRFIEASFKDGSDNTIILYCDRGWSVSLRIHNASSKVEPSLKFDVRLLGTPNIAAIVEPW